MAWDGSGNFSRVHNWQADRDAAIDILASRHDSEDDNFATGIAACLTKNNESKPTASFRPNTTRSYDIGSTSLRWGVGYFGTGFNNQSGTANYATTVTFTDATAARTITIPDATGTVILSGGAANAGQVLFTNASPFIFEGTTDDAYETTITITDPTADRTVTIQNQTGTVSLCEPISGSYRGLSIASNATNPTYQVDYTATAIVLHNSSGLALQVSSFSGTLDLTASGVDGLDTSTEANNTWYFIWAIYDGTNKKFLFSTSATSPTLPAGYTYYALVGATRNDNSGNLFPFDQKDLTVALRTNQTIQDGSFTTSAWTTLDVSAFFPSTARRIKMLGACSSARGGMSVSPNSNGHGGSYYYSDQTGSTTTMGSLIPTAREEIMTHEIINKGQNLYYYTTNAGGTLIATGWSY